MSIVFVIGAFILLFVILAYYSHVAHQKRLAELGALAQELGWQFVEDNDYSYDGQFSQFDCFCHGHSRYAYNTLMGTITLGDRPCAARMGDYHYETTSHDKDGKTQTHDHHFSYLLVQLPYGTTPDLNIRREGIFDAVKGAFGFRDINFESAEFSKRFHVTSDDKKFAYDVVYPAMIEFLLADDPPPIAIGGGYCCLGDGHDTWTAEEFRQRTSWVVEFFDLWPKYLVADLQSR